MKQMKTIRNLIVLLTAVCFGLAVIAFFLPQGIGTVFAIGTVALAALVLILCKILEKDVATAKSEAVKEFAKRLKNKIKTECNPYGKPTFDYDTSVAIMCYIDNLVKETAGE